MSLLIFVPMIPGMVTQIYPLQQLTEQELLRCGEFVLPGIAKLVVQQREGRMGRNPATGATVEIPAKQVVKARIAKQLKDVVEA